MPAHEYVSGIQFSYDQPDLGQAKPIHRVRAFTGPAHLGDMLWSSKEIRNIQVSPGQERRGVATAMWHEGHRLAAETKGIPTPKHSSDRTMAGDAWAKAVGGRLPRRSTG